MSEHEFGQVTASAAEIYEEFFVPALFSSWPVHVLEAAQVREGDHVLDVACGTGVLARAAKSRVGPGGAVTGVDVNEGMVGVAASRATDISWEVAPAESLPFDSDSFDRVVSQFGLMFFQDQVKALSEMRRVTRAGGKVGVAVWASLDETPGYAAIAELLNDLFGSEIAASLESPYSLGDLRQLEGLFTDAGFGAVSIKTMPGEARYQSIDSWLYMDIKGWTLADAIGDDDFARLQQAAQTRLSEFEQPDGSVRFDAPAHIVTATP
jgi:SAM-dependent methyltransferase